MILPAGVRPASRWRELSAMKEFWGLPLSLPPDTLVPRPDTETVVEAALDVLGAGHRGNARFASPTSEPGPARSCWRCCPNCRTPGASAPTSARPRCAPHEAMPRDLGWPTARHSSPATISARCPAQFDLVVSNPPYIRSGDIDTLAVEVRDHDPRRALDGGADGLDAYRGWCPEAARLLAPGGGLVLEVGHDQSADVEAHVNQGRPAPSGTAEDRSGGHPPGRYGPEIALIKSYWDGKKSLGISRRNDYVPATTSVQGCWPRRCPAGRLQVDTTGGCQRTLSARSVGESPPE